MNAAEIREMDQKELGEALADAKEELFNLRFQLATNQRWPLLELRRVGMTLEEVFIRIVAGEETAAEAVVTIALLDQNGAPIGGRPVIPLRR